jgi:hypothetical protein
MSALLCLADPMQTRRQFRNVPIGDILTIPGHPSGDHLNGTYVPVEEPSTAS